MINLVYPIYAAEVFAGECLEVNSHRNHPDAKSVDEDIAKIAKEKLGMKSVDGIQVVDDLHTGELSKSWGATSLGSLAKPVIALQSGLETSAPNARRYLLLRELYKTSSSLRMKEIAIKVVQVAIMVGLMMSGIGFYAMVGCAIGLFVASYLIDARMNYNCSVSAHQFAIKEIEEKDRPEVKAAFEAMNSVREMKGFMRQGVLEDLKMDKPVEEPFVQEVDKALAKAYKIVDELRTLTTVETRKGELLAKFKEMEKELEKGEFTPEQESKLCDKLYDINEELTQIREFELKKAGLLTLVQEISQELEKTDLKETSQLPVKGKAVYEELLHFKAAHERYAPVFDGIQAIADEFAKKKLSGESKANLMNKLNDFYKKFPYATDIKDEDISTAAKRQQLYEKMVSELEQSKLPLMEKGKRILELREIFGELKKGPFTFDTALFAPIEKALQEKGATLEEKIDLDQLVQEISEELKKYTVNAEEMKEPLAKFEEFSNALDKGDKASDDDLKNKAEAFFDEMKKLRDLHLSLTQRLIEKWNAMELTPSGLDLPFKLRPSTDKASDFYKEREAYHLQDLDKTKLFIQTMPGVITLLIIPKLLEPIAKINPLLILPAYGLISQGIGMMLTPAANWLGHYAIDWQFLRNTKQPRPAKVEPGVWQGAL